MSVSECSFSFYLEQFFKYRVDYRIDRLRNEAVPTGDKL